MINDKPINQWDVPKQGALLCKMMWLDEDAQDASFWTSRKASQAWKQHFIKWQARCCQECCRQPGLNDSQSRAASTNEPLPPLSASRTKHALAAASAAYQGGALEAQRNLNLWQCVWTSLARLRRWPCKYDRFSCVRSKPSLATMFEWNRRRWWRWHRWSSCPGILTCRKPTNSSSFAAWPLLMFAVCVNFKIFPSIFCIFNRGIKSEMKKRLRQKEPNCFPAGQECCLSTGHFWAAFTCPQPLVAAPDIWGLNWGWLRCKPQGDVHEICLQWGCPLRIATPDDFPDVE